MSDLIAQDVAKFVLAAYLAIVLHMFYLRHGRAYLRHWAWAWLGMTVFHLSGTLAKNATQLPPAHVLSLVSSTVYISGGYFGVMWFLLGAREVAFGRGLGEGWVKGTLLAAVSAALMVVALTVPVEWQVRMFVRAGLTVGIMGLGFVALAWVLWRSGFMRRGFGRGLIVIAFFLAGVQLVHYAVMHWIVAFGDQALPDYRYAMGLVELLGLAIMGVAILIWFFEEEWDRARDTERSLRISDARLKAAFSNAPFDFWICDAEERYVYQNDGAIGRWGDQMGKRPCDLNLPAHLLTRWTGNNSRALLGEVVHDESESLLRGKLRTRYSVLAPFRIDGDIQGFVGIGIDVTERRAAEAERAQLHERLRRSQKLESVGTLAGGIAHDFNNLLQVVLGYIEATQSDDDTLRQKAVTSIKTASNRAAQLTRQLLAFSLQQRIAPAATNLNDLIAGMTGMIEPLLTETTELDLIPAHELATVEVDQGQLEQVIMNLCINARDAMPDGGRLTIETENVLINGAYTKQHPWARSGRYVLVQVSDTGTGMSSDTLDRVFEPFFTTKKAGEGTGLGLAMVYGIVRQHSGMIHLYSELGLGTSVKMYFPVSERRADQISSLPDLRVEGGCETVLVAEDNAMVREMTQMILEEAGYSVLLASDGEEAIKAWKAHEDHVDLVLLDAVMPNVDGRGAFEAIHDMDPDVTVLFTSGYSDGALPAEFLKTHNLSVLAKPLEPDAILREVRAALDRRSV